MKIFGRIVAGCWLVTFIGYYWVNYGFDEQGPALIYVLFWLPVVAVLTLLFVILWLFYKFKRREFKFLLFIPAAIAAVFALGILSIQNGNVVITYGGTKTEIPLIGAVQPSKSHSYERLSNFPGDGGNIREMYKEGGKLHRIDGPAFIWYYDDGQPSSKEWYLNGVKHKLNGPAEVTYYIDGTIKSETWFVDGRRAGVDVDYYPNGLKKKENWAFDLDRRGADLPHIQTYFLNGNIERQIWRSAASHWHREGGPAVVYYYANGTVKRELWYQYSKVYREDGPAEVHYSRDGQVINELSWFSNGKEVQAPSNAMTSPFPTSIVFKDNGTPAKQTWEKNGELHRIIGPAVIVSHDDGTIGEEYYMIEGQLHRETGPAIIKYDELGSVISENWFIKGDEVSPQPIANE